MGRGRTHDQTSRLVTKPPVLFVHGAFTRAARWDSWVAYFGEAGFECVAPSLPGHDPPDRAALAKLTFDDYVSAISQAANNLGRPPIVVGHSMGGLLAQHVAMRSDCAALILVSASPPWRIVGTWHSARYLWRYTWPVIAGQPIRASNKAAVDLVLHDLSPAEQKELLQILAWESGLAYRTMVFGRAPVERAAIRCPVLCVTGGKDRLLRFSTAAGLASFYDAEHLVFPGQGHALVAGSLVGTVGRAVLEWVERAALAADAETSFRPSPVV